MGYMISRYIAICHALSHRITRKLQENKPATPLRSTVCFGSVFAFFLASVPPFVVVRLVKTLVRWATCKRLTFCLPKLSLLTLFPPLNSGILGLRMGPCVPTLKFFSYLGGPRKSDSSDSYHEKIHFSLNKRFHGGHEIQTHDQRTIVLPTTPYVR